MRDDVLYIMSNGAAFNYSIYVVVNKELIHLLRMLRLINLT